MSAPLRPSPQDAEACRICGAGVEMTAKPAPGPVGDAPRTVNVRVCLNPSCPSTTGAQQPGESP